MGSFFFLSFFFLFLFFLFFFYFYFYHVFNHWFCFPEHSFPVQECTVHFWGGGGGEMSQSSFTCVLLAQCLWWRASPLSKELKGCGGESCNCKPSTIGHMARVKKIFHFSQRAETTRPQLATTIFSEEQLQNTGFEGQLLLNCCSPPTHPTVIMYTRHWASWMWRAEQRKVWEVHLALARACVSTLTWSENCTWWDSAVEIQSWPVPVQHGLVWSPPAVELAVGCHPCQSSDFERGVMS